MNIKHNLSLLAASCLLLAGCTTENVLDNPQPGTGGATADDANRREVLMTLKNNLKLKTADTKADTQIATAEENYIRSLDVYVFGSDTEDGTYTFQELYYYRDDATTIPGDGDWAHSFNITPVTGKDNENNGLLRLKKGLYVKLYCVANRTKLYQTAADGTVSHYQNFDALKQSAPGQPDNIITPGVPTEVDFMTLHSAVISPTGKTEDDILVNPLPMTGSYVTPLDLTDFSVSARTQLSFKLARAVARFDVVNNAAESKFTIESISMANGQPGSGLFPIKALVTDKAQLITYPLRPIAAETQVEKKETTLGAFYTWPSPKDNEGYLILKGTYAVNQTESMPVSYQIPFQQIKDGVGSYIEVAYNHRYTIGITKADAYHLDFTLNVADWDEGGNIDDYEPENNFDKDAKIVLTTDGGASVGAYVLDNGKISVLAQDGSKFAFTVRSNSELTKELIYKSGSAQWIVEENPVVVTSLPVKAEEPSVATGTKESQFAFKVDKTALSDPTTLLPVTIRLTNTASGEYKNIVVIPTEGPEISWTAVEGNYNIFDAKTMTATLYNAADQVITLHLESETRGEKTGCSAEIAEAANTWLSGSGTLTGATADYTLTLTSAQANPSEATATVDFKSTASEVTRQITVKLRDAAMKALEESNFSVGNNLLNMTGGSTSNPKVTLTGSVGNSFTVSVISPEGVAAAVTGGSDWLGTPAVETSTLSDGSKKSVIKVSVSAVPEAKDDGRITITNPLDNKTAVIDVALTLIQGPTVSLGTNDGNLSSYDADNKKAILYNVIGQKIVLITNSTSTISTENDWLTVEGSNATSHTITIKTKQGSTSTTGKVTFTNEAGGKTDVTIELADPAITTLAVNNFKSVTGDTDNTFQDAATTGGNAKVTMANAAADNSCTLTVTSPEGITIDDSSVSSWLTVEVGEKSGTAGSYTNVVTLTLKDGDAHTDTITLNNAITGGGDLTVDVVVTAAP